MSGDSAQSGAKGQDHRHASNKLLPQDVYHQFYQMEREKAVLRHEIEKVLIHQAFCSEEGMDIRLL